MNGWLRLEHDFWDNPKTRGLGAEARLMYLASISFCNRRLTDGLIPHRSLATIAAAAELSERKARNAADKLIAAGLWLTDGAQYIIHDFLDYNPTASDILSARSEDAERKREQRALKKAKQIAEKSTQKPIDISAKSTRNQSEIAAKSLRNLEEISEKTDRKVPSQSAETSQNSGNVRLDSARNPTPVQTQEQEEEKEQEKKGTNAAAQRSAAPRRSTSNPTKNRHDQPSDATLPGFAIPSIDTTPSTTTPYQLYEAKCAAAGTDPGDLKGPALSRELGYAKKLVEANVSPDDVQSAYLWLKSQNWLTSGVTMQRLYEHLAGWIESTRSTVVVNRLKGGQSSRDRPMKNGRVGYTAEELWRMGNGEQLESAADAKDFVDVFSRVV